MKVESANQNIAEKKSLPKWIDSNASAICSGLPANTIGQERFIQSAKVAIFNPKTPLLAQCTWESIFRSLKEAANYGIEIGGVLGQAYLIPYNEKIGNETRMTCHFQMGYKGLITLARRSKTIKTVCCEPVYENDKFEVELACGRHIKHSLDLRKDRGAIIAYYCLVELENGGIQFAIMTKKEAQHHRDTFSKAYSKTDVNNVWNKNFDAMALKTCCIKALKLCPISVEALEAVRREEYNDIPENDTEKKFDNNFATDVEFKVETEKTEQKGKQSVPPIPEELF